MVYFAQSGNMTKIYRQVKLQLHLSWKLKKLHSQLLQPLTAQPLHFYFNNLCRKALAGKRNKYQSLNINVTTPTQPQLNSKAGFDTKMTLHHHHTPP